MFQKGLFIDKPKVNLEMRRTMMVQVPELIYELSEPTTTQSYDTGIQLFNTPKSFTILCEAKFSNRNWSSSQTLFGLGTGFAFAVGSRASANDYYNNVIYETGVRRYTVLAMNNTSSDSPDTDTKKCSSLFARASNTTQTVKRLAVRYDATTFKAEGFGDASAVKHAPTNSWWYLNSNYSSQTTLKFFLGNATGTMQIFKIYEGLLTDTEINNFLDKISD